MIGDTTSPDEDVPDPAGRVAAPLGPALVLVWCAEDQGRVGELVSLPSGAPGAWGVLGRGEALDDDPHPRLQLVRWRPGSVVPGQPLHSPKLSRVQLAVRARDRERIEVRNLGRAPVLHDGREAQVVEMAPGETLQIGSQLAFLCVRRPLWQAGAGPAADARWPFGAADPDGLVGESPAAWQLRQRIAFVARRPEHALITGASGTGKELVAAAIHRQSVRGRRPIVARNAATFPDGLIDAELFGNARSFPNPGMAERNGLVGQAHGSTLFLDEIAELPAELQAHLLRVLDRGEYQRLGEAHTRVADLRLLAATNRDPSALKHDLAARLPLKIDVPDLNARSEDIPLIARHLLSTLIERVPAGEGAGGPELSLSLASAIRLVRHSYVTNVRELEEFLLEALTLGEGPVLEVEIGRPAAAPSSSSSSSPPVRTAVTAPALSPAELQRCLDEHQGSIESAWRELGLASRYVLVRLVAKHGLRAGRRWAAPGSDGER